MKTCSIVTILYLCCFASKAFSQLETPSQPSIPPQNTLTKRLSGESTTRITLPDQAATPVDSIQYLYGEHNRVAEIWNRRFANGVWVLESRTQYAAYDSAGNVTLKIFQTTTNDGLTWDMNQRTATTYNSIGKLASILVQNWNANSGTWVDVVDHFYDYDQYGNLAYDADNGQYYMIGNSYNQDGFLESVAKDTYVMGWVVHVWGKQLFYDPAHPGRLVLEHTEYYYDFSYTDFNLEDSIKYTYDPAGKLRVKDYIVIYYPSLDCQEMHRQTQYFDAQNRLEKQENFSGCYVADSTAQWQLLSETDYAYDADGDPKSWVLHDYSGVDSSLLVHHYTYETVNGTNHVISAIQFSLYPNPATDELYLKMAPGSAKWAKIADMQGRQVFAQSLQETGTERLNLTGIPNGNYVLQIIGKDGKMTAKSFVIGR